MNNLIFKFWKGEITLWRSYWLIGEVVNALFILLLVNIEIYYFSNTDIYNNLPFLDFSKFNFINKIIFIAWNIFINVGIWRAAENYKGSIFWIVICLIFLSYRIFGLRLILI